MDKRIPGDCYQKRLTDAEKNDLPRLVEYAANDAFATLALYMLLRKALRRVVTRSGDPRIKTLWDYYELTELDFTRTLWECERAGFAIDQGYVDTIQQQVSVALINAEKEVNRAAGRVVNLRSTSDMQTLLFDELKIPIVKMTSGGKTGVRKPSSDKKTIERLLEMALSPKQLEVLRAIDAFGKVRALNDNFLPALRKTDRWGRLHTHLRQAGAATGRLSSSGPNLQNVKAPDRDPFSMRKAFVTEPGLLLVAADFSALEMMVLAAAAQEEEMLDIFRRGWDIHMGNASMVYGLPYEDIVKAKSIDGKVKEGSLPASAMTAYVVECIDARQAVKTIGYG